MEKNVCTFEYQSSFTFQEGELKWNNLVLINKQLLCRLFVTVRLWQANTNFYCDSSQKESQSLYSLNLFCTFSSSLQFFCPPWLSIFRWKLIYKPLLWRHLDGSNVGDAVDTDWTSPLVNVVCQPISTRSREMGTLFLWYSKQWDLSLWGASKAPLLSFICIICFPLTFWAQGNYNLSVDREWCRQPALKD